VVFHVLDFIYFRGASEPTSRVYRALERFRRQGLERVFDAFPIFYIRQFQTKEEERQKKSQSVSVGITRSGNVKNKANRTARARDRRHKIISMLYKSGGSFRNFYSTTQKSEPAFRNRFCPTNIDWTTRMWHALHFLRAALFRRHARRE
jgi:hypothetical protein